MTETSNRDAPFRTRSVSARRVFVTSIDNIIDNIIEVLAIAEGEGEGDDSSRGLIEGAMCRPKPGHAKGGRPP